ncbi:LOW QUALITY PROTEIN: zinc finger and BTB domain-containing protein 40 [Geothlypis trichas]
MLPGSISFSLFELCKSSVETKARGGQWELPSYVELLPLLYTLKAQSFCDCTIFIGNVHFRMHKVVLAPASLLFKSLLDSTDTISVDASVVTPEFPLLLEIMYSGKLPLRNNFTKVISVANSLQMFDVAVSCKNLLRDLISCSAQDQVVKGIFSQEADSSGNQAVANYLPQSGRPDEERTFIILIQRVSPFPVEAEMEVVVSPPGELTMNHTWVHQDTMSCECRSLQEDSDSGPDQPAHAEWSGYMEEELADLPEDKESIADEEMLTARLLCCREELIWSVTQLSPVEVLETVEEGFLTASEKQVALDCCEGCSQREAMDNLIRKVEEEKTLKVKLLEAVKASFPGLQLLPDLVARANISDGKGKLNFHWENYVGAFRRWETEGQILSPTGHHQNSNCIGLLIEGRGQKPGIRRWKVNSESKFEVLDKDKDKAGGASAKEAKESSLEEDKASSKTSFVYKACDKVFHFYCCLKVHMKCCQVARGKQIQHTGEIKSTKNELEKHQLEVYEMVGMAKKKKKKRLPTACDIGREFAHASGRQLSGLCYHNRTHPHVFAANHCSSKFSLWCSCCDKTFSSSAAHQKHVKAEHTDVKFHECESWMELFPMLALLQTVKCRLSGLSTLLLFRLPVEQ